MIWSEPLPPHPGATLANRNELIERFGEHAKALAQRFPLQTQRISELRTQAALLKGMLLGSDTADAPWTEVDRRVAELLDEATLDLDDSIHDIYMGRLKPAMIALRCFLEQSFFALYYSEQGLDFTVWQQDPSHFVMLHQLYDRKHVFAKHFIRIFKERRDPDWKMLKAQGTFSGRLFETLENLYSRLSASVHGRPSQREATRAQLTKSELDLFLNRFAVALAVLTEFYDSAGTGDECPVGREFRLSPETKLL